MRKIALFTVFLLFAVSVFGQEFTFQGLPWGSTREQVIAKMGEPFRYLPERGTHENAGTFVYRVNVFGYLTELFIIFNEGGMCQGSYNIGGIQNMNTEQLRIVYALVLSQLIVRYGNHHEIMTYTTNSSFSYQYQIWHLDNIHISIEAIHNRSRVLHIHYYSDTEWEDMEESYESEINKGRIVRYPSRDDF